jgi:hypothetical protein
MLTGPFAIRSKNAGWQSPQEKPVGFDVFLGDSTPRWRTWENATGSMRFNVMTMSAAGMWHAEQSLIEAAACRLRGPFVFPLWQEPQASP